MALSKILPAGQDQFAGARNLIINGAMQVAQRGSQSNVITTYGVDRFQIQGSGSQRFTYSQSTTVPSGEGFSYSAKLDVTTAYTSVASGDFQLLRYYFEGQDLQHIKYGTSDAKPLTLQFWVRSPKTGTHIVEFEHTDASYLNSQSYTIATADTWQKVTLTFDGYQTTSITNDNTDGFKISWWLMSGSTFSGGTLSSNTWHNTSANRAVGQVNVADSTSNEFYITGVQLEVGEQETPFEHRSYADELFSCQRYYQRTQSFMGAGHSVHGVVGISHLHRAMRATPTLSQDGVFVVTDGYSIDATQSSTGTQITGNNINTTGYYLYIKNISGLTAGKPYMSRLSNANGLLYDAEL